MKSVIFDLYGTLIDIHTDEEKFSFYKKVCKKLKKYKEYEPNEFKRVYKDLCKSLEKEKEEIDLLEVFKKMYDVDDTDAGNIALVFRKLSTQYEKLYRGVKKLLISLKECGYKLYVLSNAQNCFTINELKKLKIYDMFDDIFISSDYGVKKPNVLFYDKLINKYNLNPKECVMVGNDYDCDILPAKKLNLNTIFINSNLTPKYFDKADFCGFNYLKILNKINEIL